MTAHPTLSEAIKEAGLVALGRAIHLPNRVEAASAWTPRRMTRWQALIGYVAFRVGWYLVKRMKNQEGGRMASKKSVGIIAAVGAALGALMFWRVGRPRTRSSSRRRGRLAAGARARPEELCPSGVLRRIEGL